MKRLWTNDDLVAHWTLQPNELALVEYKEGANRLGCALLFKYFLIDGRFPRQKHDVPIPAIAFVATQLDVSIDLYPAYDWDGRTIKQHRADIRAFLGVRESTVQDYDEMITFLIAHDIPNDYQIEHLKTRVYARFRELQIEPPMPDRVERLVRSALHTYEQQFCAAIHAQLSAQTLIQIEALLSTVTSAETPDELSADSAFVRSAFQELKLDPGPLSLESILTQVGTLTRIRQLSLSPTLFADVPPKIVQHYHQRAAAEVTRAMRRHPEPIRTTLLAAYCVLRAQEITDQLVELLIAIVHHIGAKAQRKVEKAFLNDLKRVSGKTNLLFQLAEAALEHPDGVVKEVLYPVVNERVLRELVKEYQSSGPVYRQHVHTVMRASYRSHYRRMVPAVLRALTFHSNNDAHRPLIRALTLLKQYADGEQTSVYYANTDDVPIEGVVRSVWRDAVVKTDNEGNQRINRINYEIAVLQALRERVRCKEIWVEGAKNYGNPDRDLPQDFRAQRTTYYEALALPQDKQAFIDAQRTAMEKALAMLNAGLEGKTNKTVEIQTKNDGWIAVTPLEPQAEPTNLARLKAEIALRWPMIRLLDILKEADLQIRFTDHFKSSASREQLDRAAIQRRLLLCLYGLGTNTGLKRMSGDQQGERYSDLLYIRRRFITKDHLRAAIVMVVNAILQTRLPHIWGEGTTACASDSKKFGAWDQNLMTEWHIRYRGPGIMVYWHVEKKSVCIYSQLKSCSSSEVAAMIEGVLRHCTEMEVEKQYVDSHGQSEVAFALTHLLGFELMPRLKRIHKQVLWRPGPDAHETYPHVQPVLSTRTIQWDLIAQQYDEMVKYATAMRLGTADAEAILRRFSRSDVQHPSYAALAELGKVRKTIFLCNYLHIEELRREVHEALNVIENWNSANAFILYGKGGEIATNRLEEQEVTILSLHLLQLCLVYVNTMLIQKVLSEPQWAKRMTSEDLRGLTPLIYNHVNPYGLFLLNMNERLLDEGEVAA
jgi:TnpA family transposase